MDSVELLALRRGEWFKYRFTIANQLAWKTNLTLNPGIPKIKLRNNYDLFFAVFGFPNDLLTLNAITNWRDRCKTAICLLDELWVYRLAKYETFLKLLSEFDYVVLYYSQSVKAVSEMTGTKCFFLPPGVDSILFCPYPELPKRFVHVYSFGRRSEVTHQALLRMARENNLFYVYDSLSVASATSPKEHRFLVANMAKRSEYLIVNPGLIDRPDVRGNQFEIGNRYFEAAAAGAIMIGEYPRSGEFEQLFNWPDAVIHVPYDSNDIGTIIKELDNEPIRKDKIRRNGVVQSLLRHDWANRWEAILKTAGLEPMPELLRRKKRLEHLATAIESGHA